MSSFYIFGPDCGFDDLGPDDFGFGDPDFGDFDVGEFSPDAFEFDVLDLENVRARRAGDIRSDAPARVRVGAQVRALPSPVRSRSISKL